jgi:AcrR family transcriptional regulator
MVQLPYDERLERLLSTAAQVFAQKGFHPTTMRDLSRATGLSLAGIYYYVRSKDELLALIQERCFSRVLDGARQAIAVGTDPREQLERFIEHHVTFFAEHMAEMKVLAHEAESLSRERQAPINALKRRYLNMLLGLVHDLGHDRTECAEPRVATYALFGMMNWIYTWYDPEGPVSPSALARQFAALFMHGAAPSTTAVSHGG